MGVGVVGLQIGIGVGVGVDSGGIGVGVRVGAGVGVRMAGVCPGPGAGTGAGKGSARGRSKGRGLRATTGWADLYHRQQNALFLKVLAVAQPRWKAREHVAQHLAQVSSSSSKYKGNYHALRLARYTAPSVLTYLLNLPGPG